MALQTITLYLPDDLYQRVKDSAERAHRTIEEELLAAVSTIVSTSVSLPDDLAAAVADLSVLPDDAVWQAAQSRLSARESARLEALHLKRQREGLSESESQELSGLVARYERAMLVRAQATLLLKERGFDVSKLGPPA